MVGRTAKNSQFPSTTEQINVTNLSAGQKRELFINYLNREGFMGFVKEKVGEQLSTRLFT
jgi:hypothetical protein